MPILVTDFDGTFTRRDFFDLILERHDPPGARAHWQRFLDGEMTTFEGIAGVLAALRTDEAGANALVDALAPPAEAAAAARRLQAAGWQIVVASAGCRWYIDRLLDRLGLDFTVHANPGTFAPESGLAMEHDRRSRFHDEATGIDKPAVVRDALSRDAIVAYAGDSHTDREAALLVEAPRRFATGWLGRQFAGEAVPHMPFTAWPEIAARLLGEGGFVPE